MATASAWKCNIWTLGGSAVEPKEAGQLLKLVTRSQSKMTDGTVEAHIIQQEVRLLVKARPMKHQFGSTLSIVSLKPSSCRSSTAAYAGCVC